MLYFASTSLKLSFEVPHIGQAKSSGTSSQEVFGFIPSTGYPFEVLYSQPQTLHTCFMKKFLFLQNASFCSLQYIPQIKLWACSYYNLFKNSWYDRKSLLDFYTAMVEDSFQFRRIWIPPLGDFDFLLWKRRLYAAEIVQHPVVPQYSRRMHTSASGLYEGS